MVAGMIVDVRDRGVEADPAEQLPEIRCRLSTDAAQLIGEQQVRPPAAIGGAVFGLQQGEGADHAMAPVSRLAPVAIKALDQQHIGIAHSGEATLRHLQPAAAGQQQQAVLHARLVPGVGRRRELGQPEGVVGLHGGLGAGAAHRRAGLADQLLHLLQGRACPQGFLAEDRIGRQLDALQIESAVEATLQRRWINAAAKANRTAAVIRSEQQQIEIAGLPQAAMASDHPPSPVIRQGIAQCPEEAPQTGRLEGALAQPQLHRIELHRVRPLAVAAAINERAHGLVLPIAALRKPARRDELRAARRDHIDVALKIRWHDRRAPGLGETERETAGRGGSEVVVETLTARGLAGLAGRLQGLAFRIPVGIGHKLQLIEQPQHPEGTEVGGHRGAGLAALHIGHSEAAHAHPFGHVLQPPAAPQPGGADVAPQPLQGLLQGRWGVLDDGAELGQDRQKAKNTMLDDSLNSSYVA